jgi:deferrochelatase/peroxidase EfeB
MSTQDSSPPNQGRRRFLASAALAASAAPISALATPPAIHVPPHSGTEPFFGRHQGGIATPQQRHTYFMAFDVVSPKREDVIALLQRWTEAAAKMTQGAARSEANADATQIPEDSGATVGLPASRLTLTFGFGPGLFEKDGADRFGVKAMRPEALADLPRFNGDQLVAERSGGDLSVQACTDDPQVAEHALRRMVTLAYGVAKIRWAQTGFTGNFKPGETPRNQMGFKDGTMNIPVQDNGQMTRLVWAGSEGPAWMQDGSYMVVRSVRIALEHWDRMKLAFQEQTVGRHKASGAPIGKQRENDPLDLDAMDKDGNPVISENAHVRLAAPESNDGAQILRRGYAYDNGVAYIAERWPPWRQSTTFDAGLLFVCYQRDPRTGFSRIFENMAKFDMLNQFTTHVGSGLFACPPGAKPGEFVGQRLFA